MSKPNWTRDELILALDLYFREPSARGSKTQPGVLELSYILIRLPIHNVDKLEEDFRNPNGV
jgi:5-methylcytosine-specific restriction protein A